MDNASEDQRLGWGWLDGHPETGLEPEGPDTLDPDTYAEDTEPEPGAIRRIHELAPPGGWLAAAAVLALAVGLITAGIVVVTGKPTTVAPPPISNAPTQTVSSNSTTTTTTPLAPVDPACAGLGGPDPTTVTDQNGDTDTLTGVIAAFEYGYYEQRSAGALAPLLAPQAGLDLTRLAGGIASIPTGTRHCVAITPQSATSAAVHIVELHPDGSRIDYLQVIDVRLAIGATVITNIQKAG